MATGGMLVLSMWFIAMMMIALPFSLQLSTSFGLSKEGSVIPQTPPF
jgi:hypothetical protein